MNDQSRERFSNRSLEQIATLEGRLQDICEVAIMLVGFSVIEGYRSEKEQTRLYAEGHSKLKYPQSRHNETPSEAMDLVPYTGSTKPSNEQWDYLSNAIKYVGQQHNVEIIWGGDWKENPDRYHFELQESVAEIIDETKLSMDR